MNRTPYALLIVALWLEAVTACRDVDPKPRARLSSATVTATATTSPPATPALPPLDYLPPIDLPPHNLLTPAKISLGKMLFFDPRLSADQRMSCAHCHQPQSGWADGASLSLKSNGKRNRRHTPSLYNSGYKTAWLWDGRAGTLEAAIEIVWREQLGADFVKAAARIAAVTGYQSHFRASFKNPSVTPKSIVDALASFVRTIRSGNAPFDRQQRGDQDAIVPAAKRGWQLFRRLGCATCHAPPLFTDLSFHNTGVGYAKHAADRGRAAVSGKPRDEGRFLTPSLRSVSRHPPYLHDGSAASLDEAIAFMLGGGKPNPNLDQSLSPIQLSEAQRTELRAFLQSLTGEATEAAPPQLP